MTAAARRGALFVVVFVVGLAAWTGAAGAHPLGNFTVNQAAHLRIQPEAVLIDFVVDMAEIPTVQERRNVDTNSDDTFSPTEQLEYASRTCKALARLNRPVLNGSRLNPTVAAARMDLLEGQAGLQTLRVECTLKAEHPPVSKNWQVQYRMESFPDRAGWREVTAEGDGTTLIESDVPEQSSTKALLEYPDAADTRPLDRRSAELTARAGGESALGGGLTAVLPPGADNAARGLLGFLGGQEFGFALGLSAMGVSFGLGAAHALAPGHGKAVMGATMLGPSSRFTDALTLGLSVAASHTVAVLVLAVVLSVTTVILPEDLYPLLALASGVLVLGVGVSMVRRALRPRTAPHHDHEAHDHEDEPDHHGHDHGHDHHGHDHHGPGRRSLVALGLAGGIVPAPSAVIVLLGASAFGRTWFGILLVVTYGLGMAVTLLAAGYFVLRVRRLARRRWGRWEDRVDRLLPLVASVVVLLAGLALGARGLIELL